jgi:2-succinyl-5-enolpyruvyl-6-hydroxy-3-cyclohexene-1-carboxylate synthase
MGDVLTRAAGFGAACKPSVVIRLGDTPVSKAQRLWIEAAEPESIWWLDEGGHWGEPSHRVTRVVRGGATSLLEGASQALGKFGGRRRAWCQRFEAANAVARKTVADRSAEGESWSGLSVAATVARCVPEDGLLFASNSMSIRWLDVALANRRGALRVLCSRGASGIDGITSTALGCAAGVDRPAILLTGDLALLHDLSGLLITRRETIPLTIVVVDDNGGGIFSFLPVAEQSEAVGFERLFHTPHDVSLERVAQLFELDYHAVDSIDTLEAALVRATSRRAVSIVHARVDAAENTRRFREIVGQACQAVDARHAS